MRRDLEQMNHYGSALLTKALPADDAGLNSLLHGGASKQNVDISLH